MRLRSQMDDCIWLEIAEQAEQCNRIANIRPGETIGWRQGFGILFDDLVAALCTLLVMAVGWRLWN